LGSQGFNACATGYRMQASGTDFVHVQSAISRHYREEGRWEKDGLRLRRFVRQ